MMGWRNRRRRLLGRWTERAVAVYLRLKGWRILAMNWQTPFAEIDLLCDDGSGWVIVEVKYRSSNWGEPITSDQRARLERAAHYLLSHHTLRKSCQARGIRLDLILILHQGWKINGHHYRDWNSSSGYFRPH